MDSQIENLSNEFGLSRSEVIRQGLTLYFNIISDIDRLTNIRDLSKEDMKVSQENIRDVHFINLDSFDISICISYSSSGGIGPKEHDTVSVEGEVVGSIMARTALIKMLAISGQPTTVLLNFSNEYIETGKNIKSGVESECKKIGINNVVAGHTEENIETCQTGITVTAIGILDRQKRSSSPMKAGDKILCIGQPSVGKEILDMDLPQIEDVKILKRVEKIKRILPVGHHGIKKELENHLDKDREIEWRDTDIDVELSAGPSSAVLAISSSEIDIDKIDKRMRIPVTEIATIK